MNPVINTAITKHATRMAAVFSFSRVDMDEVMSELTSPRSLITCTIMWWYMLDAPSARSKTPFWERGRTDTPDQHCEGSDPDED
jgi:hypothetical protein